MAAMDDAASAGRELAELILSMGMVTAPGQHARALARRVLGIENIGEQLTEVAVTTNGTTRFIPRDEPLFLLRGQDVSAPATISFWTEHARLMGASDDILKSAADQCNRMIEWQLKPGQTKIADLPAGDR